MTLFVQLLDAAGVASRAPANLTGLVTGTTVVPIVVVGVEPGQFVARYSLSTAGRYEVSIMRVRIPCVVLQ